MKTHPLGETVPENNFSFVFQKLSQGVKHYLYTPHAVYQLSCLSQTDGKCAEFITGLLSYECMWTSDSLKYQCAWNKDSLSSTSDTCMDSSTITV